MARPRPTTTRLGERTVDKEATTARKQEGQGSKRGKGARVQGSRGKRQAPCHVSCNATASFERTRSKMKNQTFRTRPAVSLARARSRSVARALSPFVSAGFALFAVSAGFRLLAVSAGFGLLAVSAGFGLSAVSARCELFDGFCWISTFGRFCWI